MIIFNLIVETIMRQRIQERFNSTLKKENRLYSKPVVFLFTNPSNKYKVNLI